MDAVKFVKEYLRMCTKASYCEECPAFMTDFCKDNGNCTAVGGFCTAVPGCLLLREYLDTGLTPEQCETAKLLLNLLLMMILLK